MSERPSSRLDAVRRQVAVAKRALAVASTAAFGAVLIWAHGSHPGAAAAPASSASNLSASVDEPAATESFDFGQGSVAPSAGAQPDTSSHSS